MDNYPNNSNAYRVQSTLNEPVKEEKPEEKEVVTPVGTEPAKVKKKTVKDKAASIFIKEDIKSVCRYVFRDILVPAMKKTFVSMINNGTNMMVFGDSRGYDDRDRNYRGSRSSYQDYYDRDRDYDYRGSARSSRRSYDSPYDYDIPVFNSAGAATETLRRMRNQIYDQGQVSVSFLYRCAEWPTSFTTDHYGWTDLRNAEVLRDPSGGYWISMPRPRVIEL